MSQANVIKQAMSDFISVLELRDGVKVATQCIYPSGAFVNVVVRGGEDTFIVSDEGWAVREIESAGAHLANADKSLRQVVKPFGLEIHSGVIRSPQCGLSNLPAVIAIVANASSESAEWLFSHTKIKHDEKFREAVALFLRRDYGKAVQEETIIGNSNKPHRFDNILRIDDHRKLLIDAVSNDRNSINARVVANLDVKSANIENIIQRIVYNDMEQWNAEDLSLLSVGAPVVAYSKVKGVIDRLARAA